MNRIHLQPWVLPECIEDRFPGLFPNHRPDITRPEYQDQLTGIPNRWALNAMWPIETWYGVLLFDIDHFKRVNDTLGHQAGDAVLRQFAERIQSMLRGEDMMFRYGGEEFVVLASGGDTAALGDKIRRVVADAVFELPGHSLPITCSVGVTLIREGDSLEEAVHRADKACYRAKGDGRNRVVVMEGAL